MATPAQILNRVFDCVDQLNQQLPPEQRLAKSSETAFTGAGSTLDSLSIITLLVAVEQSVGELGITIALLDHPELANEAGPFRTLGSLAALIGSRL